ncbi:hypothetical protein E3P89_00033 [Wallemia ichthyophaga]|uniref:Uncharacterized protein n=1 Tax=Wallemia ichthyophaga TaxID=245174 RepID=A0A4T0KYR6_WALIC|nr:hypothetical protein E3P91_00136 [Wallemia ichthyophaga]TIA94471.1 hypothetical protein E3P97_00137 [Wallemia ichthyophaga]TIB06563.1 hypothetical protein E3P96_00320 [Wallemia ichthyophaga]TIB17363.1 hypothetical protein E3P90_00137 [Wallemia ichthyophaga]TIB18608.1 hypothetical protein E3P93_00137 [Wallemia ichthyophaga]
MPSFFSQGQDYAKKFTKSFRKHATDILRPPPTEDTWPLRVSYEPVRNYVTEERYEEELYTPKYIPTPEWLTQDHVIQHPRFRVPQEELPTTHASMIALEAEWWRQVGENMKDERKQEYKRAKRERLKEEKRNKREREEEYKRAKSARDVAVCSEAIQICNKLLEQKRKCKNNNLSLASLDPSDATICAEAARLCDEMLEEKGLRKNRKSSHALPVKGGFSMAGYSSAESRATGNSMDSRERVSTPVPFGIPLVEKVLAKKAHKVPVNNAQRAPLKDAKRTPSQCGRGDHRTLSEYLGIKVEGDGDELCTRHELWLRSEKEDEKEARYRAKHGIPDEEPEPVYARFLEKPTLYRPGYYDKSKREFRVF